MIRSTWVWIALMALGAMRTAAGEAEPPHRIVGNLFNVGTRETAVFLVTTAQGHVLIDSGYTETAPIVRSNLDKLGIRLADVKLLLSTHAHRDHVGGLAQLKAWSGARVLVMAGDEAAVRAGSDGRFKWPAVPVDHVLHDREAVSLGEVTLTAHHTPGHTRGATTWTIPVSEAGRAYNVVIMDSVWNFPTHRLVGNNDYPRIADDFRKSLQVVKQLPCDVLLDPHGQFYRRLTTMISFVDPAGCRRFMEKKQRQFDAVIAEQSSPLTLDELLSIPHVPFDGVITGPHGRIAWVEATNGAANVFQAGPPGVSGASACLKSMLEEW